MGAVIAQSKKLSATQQRYSVTEIKLLAIVETLEEFKGMLWGQQIRSASTIKIISKMSLASLLTEYTGGGHSWKRMAQKSNTSKVFATQLKMLSCV
jgi:hypothetical protein